MKNINDLINEAKIRLDIKENETKKEDEAKIVLKKMNQYKAIKKENEEKIYFKDGYIYNLFFSLRLSHISAIEYMDSQIIINSYGRKYSYLIEEDLFFKIKKEFMNINKKIY